MFKRFRTWLVSRFLPAWAVDTLKRDNERLTIRNNELRAEVKALNAYINGMQRAMHDMARAKVVMPVERVRDD